MKTDIEFSQNELEAILKNKAAYSNNEDVGANKSVPRQRADKGADLDDLADMIAKLVSKSMRKSKVEFSPDEGSRPLVDASDKVDSPRIFFSIIDSAPKNELKPMVRQEINELTEDKQNRRMGTIFGKRYVNIVQFDIFAPDYTQANTVMKNFEELILNYSSYLKENGIAEIFLQRRFTDRNLDAYRQHFSVRSLQYYVETEKLFARFGEVVESVSVFNGQQKYKEENP